MIRVFLCSTSRNEKSQAKESAGINKQAPDEWKAKNETVGAVRLPEDYEKTLPFYLNVQTRWPYGPLLFAFSRSPIMATRPNLPKYAVGRTENYHKAYAGILAGKMEVPSLATQKYTGGEALVVAEGGHPRHLHNPVQTGHPVRCSSV